MLTNQASKIKRVLISGGVHGNELTGIYLVKKLENYPHLVRRSNFETVTLLANPKAFLAVRRYIDRDLNRCFQQSDLQNTTLFKYEEIRAREINYLFGANGITPVDLILDLHSTTSNMGVTLIVDDRPFNLQLAAYLKTIHPSVNVYVQEASKQESSGFLMSMCKFGCTIEVGAIAQGTLQADLFKQTEDLVRSTLDYIEQFNRDDTPRFESEITFYLHQEESIDYPRNERDEIQAIIHPQLQFKDYHPLSPGDPLFLTFEGEEIFYNGTSTIYPVFINEASYYEKGIAMSITQKQQKTIV